jgi:hypothetical protein
VRKSYEPQLVDVKDTGYCFLDQRPHPLWSCVKQQRLIVYEQILVEGKAAGDFADGSADPVDPLGDFIDAGSGSAIGYTHDGFLPKPHWLSF